MADGGKKTKAAAAAAAEIKPDPVVGDFRGILLEMPPKLPAVLALDLAELRASNDDMEGLGIVWRVLKRVIPKNLDAVREKVAEDDDALDDLSALIEEILKAITEPYSVTPGESEASVTSSTNTGD